MTALSVLDLAFVPTGSSAGGALRNTLESRTARGALGLHALSGSPSTTT